MSEETFNVDFGSEADDVKGTAEIVVQRDDDEIVFLARNIRFVNTGEELVESGLVIEPELRISPLADDVTDDIHWIDADTDEDSGVAALIGAAIEGRDK